MKPILIDSDVLIEVSRQRDEPILHRWFALSDASDSILCSPVTVAEIWYGGRPSEQSVLEALFRAILCVPIGYEIGHRAGQYLARFSKSHSLELGDALIAATASIHGAALWTRNRKHYPMKGISFY